MSQETKSVKTEKAVAEKEMVKAEKEMQSEIMQKIRETEEFKGVDYCALTTPIILDHIENSTRFVEYFAQLEQTSRWMGHKNDREISYIINTIISNEVSGKKYSREIISDYCKLISFDDGENIMMPKSFDFDVYANLDERGKFEYILERKMSGGRRIVTFHTLLKKLYRLGVFDDAYDLKKIAEIHGYIKEIAYSKDYAYTVHDNVYEGYQEAAYVAPSCMLDGDNEVKEWVGWYDSNDSVKIILMRDSNGIVLSRALLWENAERYNEEENEWESIQFMDKIYPENSFTVKLMQRYGQQNGYVTRDSTDNKTYIRASMSIWDSGYPYLDTLCHAYRNKQVTYYSENNVHLYNIKLDPKYIEMFDESNTTYSKLRSENGEGFDYTPSDYVCERCDCRVNEDETCLVYMDENGTDYEKWCNDCSESFATPIDGELFIDKLVTRDHYTGESILTKNAETCAVDGEEYHVDSMIRCALTDEMVWAGGELINDVERGNSIWVENVEAGYNANWCRNDIDEEYHIVKVEKYDPEWIRGSAGSGDKYIYLSLDVLAKEKGYDTALWSDNIGEIQYSSFWEDIMYYVQDEHMSLDDAYEKSLQENGGHTNVNRVINEEYEKSCLPARGFNNLLLSIDEDRLGEFREIPLMMLLSDKPEILVNKQKIDAYLVEQYGFRQADNTLFDMVETEEKEGIQWIANYYKKEYIYKIYNEYYDRYGSEIADMVIKAIEDKEMYVK